MPYIYKITNNLNGKIYIGKTLFSIEKRWKEHCKDFKEKDKEKRPLYLAMKKYGIQNFSIAVVEECDEKIINEREKYWIEYYGSFKNGYNATLGGDGAHYIDYDLVAATYQQIQNVKETARLCNIDPSTVSRILKIKNIVVKTSAEVIKDTYSIPVHMFSLENEYLKTFASSRDAAKFLIDNSYTNCKLTTIRQHISEVCKGKRKSAAKFKWKYTK